MNLTLTVSYDDRDPDVVSTKPVDQIKFERKFGLPISEVSDAMRTTTDPDTGATTSKPTERFRMEWIWSLAYWAVERARPDLGSFDEWAEHVAGITMDMGGDPPLDQGRSTTS